MQEKYESIVDRDYHEETEDVNLARVPAKIARLPHPFEQTLALLNQAETKYRKLLETDADNPTIQSEYASLLLSRGTALRDNRQYDSARRDLNATVDRLKQLTARFPNPVFEQMLAQAYHEMAVLMTYEGSRKQLSTAEDLYLQSRRIRQELAARHTAEVGVEYRHDLATSDDSLGDLYLSFCKFKNARQCYDDSLKMREELHQERPSNWERSFQLARAYNNFVNIYAEYGDPDRPDGDRKQLDLALEFSAKARRLQIINVSENPANVDYRLDLGWSNNCSASILVDLDRHNEAAPLAFAAQQIYTELMTRDPSNPRYHSALAETYVILAKYYRQSKNEPLATQSLAAADESLRHMMLEPRAQGPAVENPDRKNDIDFITAAAIHALRAETLQGAARAAELKLAMQQLQERDKRSVQGPWRLERDLAFNALREEPEFKKLLADVKTRWREGK